MSNPSPNQPLPPPVFQFNQDRNFDVKNSIFRYLKSWPWIVLCMLLGVVAAFMVNRYSTPTWSVESTVLVKEADHSVGSELFETSGFLKPSSNIENEIGILKSYSLAEEAVAGLDINVQTYQEGVLGLVRHYGGESLLVEVDWQHPQMVGGMIKVVAKDENSFDLSINEEDFQVYNPNDPFYKTDLEIVGLKEGTYSFGQWVEGSNFKFRIKNIAAVAGEDFYFQLQDTPSLAKKYKAELAVAPINEEASILSLTLETPVRRLGEDYLNKLMEVYLKRELEEKNRTSDNTVRFIENQLSGITDSLTFFEDRLEQYRTQNKVFNLSEEGNLIFERMQELETEKSQTEINLKYYQTLQNYLNNNSAEDLVVPSVVGISDPLLNSLVMNLGELQSEQVRLSANFSEQAPAVREIKNKIANTKKALRENVNSAIANTQTLISEIKGNIRQIDQEINTLPETERRLLGIQRKFNINENIYVYLLEKRAEAEITRASNAPKNSVLDWAKAGDFPVSPKTKVNFLLGLLLGFMIPVAFIYTKDFFNVKIEDVKELEKLSKVPVVAKIGRAKYGYSNPVLDKPKSPVTESFRSLRADMTYLSPNKKYMTILFTSTISGEGKTFCAVNTASAFALKGKKTLLMGLDLRKPKIAADFKLNNDRGISTCLSADIPWQKVVQSTSTAHLDVLLSGPIPPNPAEILLQEKFNEIMQEIKEKYEVVIMDCPPVGLVSETKELFRYADINIFVFRQEYSRKENVELLNDLHERGGVKKLYGLLNDIHIRSTRYGYGYGYDYGGYGGYHEEEGMPWWKRIFDRR
ncbi:polysaccharide biosynthesis tyrosine autokinase [Echinicola sp. CAU 1574]|uniref:non-specific protein-tyrosine kinase n=1 Tax=Echinicola arenosa TaxID=2774144 RepID=A0ABR9AMN3_9BACT|nr:polysaccharide biosynthesis tyrosine autokinase [Echinicola arenosa]MBD8490061.1 polysaccharide biosynthesis tyrosine autokinase [Echinicola arenosa]